MLVPAIFLAILLLPTAGEGERPVELDGLKIAVLTPQIQAHQKTKIPVVVLSHGGAGGIESLKGVAGALTRRGFVVVMPVHADGQASTRPALEGELLWRSRVGDVVRVLDGLSKIEKETGVELDRNAVAVMGIGLGGDCAMMLGGANAVWRGKDVSLADARVKAVVAVEPGAVNGIKTETMAVPAVVFSRGTAPPLPSGSYSVRVKTRVAAWWIATDDSGRALAVVSQMFLQGRLCGDSNAEAMMISGSVVAGLPGVEIDTK